MFYRYLLAIILSGLSLVANSASYVFEYDGKMRGTSLETFGVGNVALGRKIDLSNVDEHQAKVDMSRGMSTLLNECFGLPGVNTLRDEVQKLSTGYIEDLQAVDMWPNFRANYLVGRRTTKGPYVDVQGTALDGEVVALSFSRTFRNTGTEDILAFLNEKYGPQAFAPYVDESKHYGTTTSVVYGNLTKDEVASLFGDLNSRIPDTLIHPQVDLASKGFAEHWLRRKDRVQKFPNKAIVYASIKEDSSQVSMSLVAFQNPMALADFYEKLLTTCGEARSEHYRRLISKKRSEIGNEL